MADFGWAVGIEDTFVGQPSGRRGRVLDEYELIDHYRRWRTDIDLIAALGVRLMRYGVNAGRGPSGCSADAPHDPPIPRLPICGD